ncbi:Reverse transcriptase domain-containing protein [Aphis craccivora]|uniref:Reverse transcriptase domain-containing protein n=1 Tax=Aphis craccivora TaxID=307492 RepID=A0A6G0ZGZ3_APHCR|nr:Reverse transcriptase domain-containing protein [Aphis craccivora]
MTFAEVFEKNKFQATILRGYIGTAVIQLDYKTECLKFAISFFMYQLIKKDVLAGLPALNRDINHRSAFSKISRIIKIYFESLLNKTPPTLLPKEIDMLYSTAKPYIETLIKQIVNNIIKKLRNNKHSKRILGSGIIKKWKRID